MRPFPRIQSAVEPLYQQDAIENDRKVSSLETHRQESSTNTRHPPQKQTGPSSKSDENGSLSTRHRRENCRKFSLTYRIAVFKVPSKRANMYEPVSDSCVTVVGPKHSPAVRRHQQHDQNERQQQHHQQQQRYQQHQQQEQSDADDESAATTPIANNNNEKTGLNPILGATKEQSSQQQQQQESRSPHRLPRRKKNKAPPIAKHESSPPPLDLANCQQLFNNRKIAGGMRTGNGDKCIDIDHITLERNYKNKRLSVATQTSHVVPYRLKFWPKWTGTAKCGEDAKAFEHVACCCRTLSQWCLSQVGLAVILFCWALLGAFAFYQTEGPREQEQSKELQRLQNELTVDLSTNLRQASTHEESWPKTIQKYLLRHETLLLEAVSAGYGEGGGGSIWTYPGCILFAVSLLTTLGFGAPVPRTPLGRGSAVLFSAIGIPLHFLLILNIGNMTAGILHGLATRETRSEIPNVNASGVKKTARWLKWLPLFAILVYYLVGVILFGFVRYRGIVDSLMFPLDFTATGGVAKTSGHVRIFYALYLEVAVTLAAIIVSLVQVTATRGFIDLGLRLGLLTNT